MNLLMARLLLVTALVVGLVLFHHYDKSTALSRLNAEWSEKLEAANREYQLKEKQLVAALNRNAEVQHERVERAEAEYRNLVVQLGRLRKQIQDHRQRAVTVSQASSAPNGTGESGILDESLKENVRLAREADRLALKVQGLQDYINTILREHQNDRKDAFEASPW